MAVGELLEKSTITNIVALGDSQIELDAAQILAESFKQACIKTVKYLTGPSVVELIQQNELVNESFYEICNSGRSLVIHILKPQVDAEMRQFNSSYSRQKLSLHFQDKDYGKLAEEEKLKENSQKEYDEYVKQ
mmetsp:Transcript_48628/g.35806  ORF Transcript_48628/g.35806 Transcript_48628/m.35806 type:complete len:133 (+) Transcript_48628:1387-1785(+)|eukprot:CAMPEP_0202964218 /NCGR_PEP_ID=MMETSP1396-20130829/8294_1 /ASSEMBLY_ACC=CAM_ASM_000872 /TAXON_ID= /ORGANISM="Pseudokeronopsis sp., Strain Brazil" /LENGTH=132 /DNA_ID=CAMNT_0049686147 /DNA_START=1527 /DNA_END=1925 /DNA_ORIENTATION=-